MAWTTPRTWTTDELVTASMMNAHVRDNLNAVPHLLVRKTADESVTSSTTLQNDDSLLFAVGASEVWLFHMALLWNAGVGFDLKWSFTWPAGATATVTTTFPVAGGTTTPTTQNIVTSGDPRDLEAQATNIYVTLFDGFIANSTTPGNVQFQWAQGFSSGTSTTVKANSVISGMQLA